MNTLFFVEVETRRLGRWFIEVDRDSNSRTEIIRRILSGDVYPIKILEIDEEAGSCRDVTAEILREAADQMVTRPHDVDHQAARFDYAQDHRKNGVVA